MKGNDQKNIIVKKVKKFGPPEFHGGSWKLAYADFVTALMAFFLFLWLLNVVPSKKLQGIAQYFEPTLAVMTKSGVYTNKEQGRVDSKEVKEGDKVKGIQYGVQRTGEIVSIEKRGEKVNTQDLDNKIFISLKKNLDRLKKNDDFSNLKKNISYYETPEGLVIQITDEYKNPLFNPGSAALTNYAKMLLVNIAHLVKLSPNFIQISGYTDKSHYSNLISYSNWELSTDRANSARRYIVSQGIASERIAKIIGMADTDPLQPEHPYSYENRRITITLLRNSVMPFYKISTPVQDLQ